MKKTLFTFLSIAFVSGMILMSSCTKEGPAGATGAAGPQGPAGEDGINGTDGTAGCAACHDGGTSQGMFAKIIQWEASTHATGGNFERNGADCAECHTSQGHREFIATGTVAADVSNPNPINCYTCHNIHDTYTAADLSLVGASGFTTLLGDAVDFGKGNVCANCHQSRPLTVPDLLVATYDIGTNSRWGSHHGPQAQIFSGVGLVNIPGDIGYGGNMHMNQITDGCVTCHMAEAYGVQSGGHTMKMSYDYHGSDVYSLGCATAECHGDTDADLDNLADKIDALKLETTGYLAALAVELKLAGIMKSTGSLQTGVHNSVYAAAYLNYQSVTEDKSLGVHNPTYVRALLQNSIKAVQAELAK